MLRGILLGVMALLVGGCMQSTSVSTVWKTNQELPREPFRKVCVLVVNSSPSERRAGEDVLVSRLRPGQGVASYTLIPELRGQDRDAIRQVLLDNNIEGAVVLRLVSVDKAATYYPPTYETGYWYSDPSTARVSPGYTLVNTTVHTEVSVYAVATRQLIWAGDSVTEDPQNMRDLVEQVAAASADELKKQGLLR